MLASSPRLAAAGTMRVHRLVVSAKLRHSVADGITPIDDLVRVQTIPATYNG